MTAQATVAPDASAGDVKVMLQKGESVRSFTFTILSPNCPKITISQKLVGKGYQLTAAVQGGQSTSKTTFTWTVGERSQQGQSVIYKDVPFSGEGSPSIVFGVEDLPEGLGDYVKVDVTVTGYASSCQLGTSQEFQPDFKAALYGQAAKSADSLAQAINDMVKVKRGLGAKKLITPQEELALTNVLQRVNTADKELVLIFNTVNILNLRHDDLCKQASEIDAGISELQASISKLSNAEAAKQLSLWLGKMEQSASSIYNTGLACHQSKS
jgi:hypothetical protein